MPIKKSQQSFAAGELSPSLHHRIDLAKYHVGLKTARNAYSHKHGGISNRAGLQYVGDTGNHAVVARLIPFQFNTDQTYSLEFGELTMRVIKDGAYVLDGAGPAIYELVTTYTESDLALLKFTQSADVMTITHPDFDPRELSRTDHDAWVIADITFGPTLLAPTGGNSGSTKDTGTTAITGITQANPGKVTSIGHGLSSGNTVHISGVAGMTEVNGFNFKINKFDPDNYTLVGIDTTAYTAYTSGGTSFEKAKSYKYKIVAIDDDTKEQTLPLTITTAPFLFPLTGDTHNVVSWNAVTGASKYDVYKEDNGFYGYIGTAEGLSFIDDNINPDFSDTPQEEQDPFDGADNKPGCVAYYEQRRIFGRTNNKRQAFFGTQTGNQSNMSVSFPAKANDAIEFTILARQVNEIRHLLPASDLLAFTSGGIWKINGGGGGLAITPSNILVGNQSGIGSSDVPPVLAGDFILFVEDGGDILNDIDYSFERDKYVAVDRTLLASHLFEDDQIKEVAYARKPESIVWCVMTSGLLLGMTYIPDQDVWAWHWHETDGLFESICTIREGTEDAVYVIVNRTIDGETKRFTERLHTRKFTDVRDAFFVDSGLTLDNPYTISGATQANPCVLTVAAHPFSDGDYVDLSDIVGMTELNDKQYKIANKTTNTFELTDSDGIDINSTGYTEYSSAGKAREAVITISGLDHLEGKAVAVLANGNVETPNPVVSSGSITLSNKSSRVHVGLAYISDIETLDIDTIDGRITAKKISVGEVKVDLLNSRGMWAGPNSDKLTEWKQRGIAGEDYGEATALFTGEATMGVTSMWRDGGGTLIRQQYPLPLTILSIIPKVSVGG